MANNVDNHQAYMIYIIGKHEEYKGYHMDLSRLKGFVAAARYLSKQKPLEYSFTINRYPDHVCYQVISVEEKEKFFQMCLRYGNTILPKKFKDTIFEGK